MKNRDIEQEPQELEAEQMPQEELADEQPQSIDEQADAALNDITSSRLYSLNDQPEYEDIGPDEIPDTEIAHTKDIASIDEDDAELSPGDEVDELPESIEIAEEEEQQYRSPEEEEREIAERNARGKRRLRIGLIVAIIILLLVGGAFGVFIWRGNTPPDIKQSDPEAMQASKAGQNKVVFQALDATTIPKLADYFGMTPEEAASASKDMIKLDEGTSPAKDDKVPALTTLRNARVVGKNGEIVINVSFGLNAEGKIVFETASFDLDAFGVADAQFSQLIADKTVAASILTGIGLDEAAVRDAKLTVTDNPEAVTSRDTAAKETAEFTGPTNKENAPKDWKLIETYDHTAGASLGDNSVIRTITIELR